ncbi:hypothetical protein Tco_1323783 [Tanacetum coccineum]
MDWLANHKAEIICHEKVVRTSLPDGKVLRVIGYRPNEKLRLLMSAKAKEQKYGYCKHHKKRAKTGQKRTRDGTSTEEPGIY